MDKAFIGLGIKREDVYIANIVKCRPPQNRNPEADEAKACLDYLRSQVMLVKPKIIVLLGSVALKNILGNEYGITASRGKWVEKGGILYMPTWHPAALLRDETKKIDFWRDLKAVQAKISILRRCCSINFPSTYFSTPQEIFISRALHYTNFCLN